MRPKRRFRIPDELVTLIRGLHPDLKKKVRLALQVIIDDPCRGKALKDDLSGYRSFRVGRFRIIYRHEQADVVEIVAVGPRRTIYEETYRRLRKG